MIQRLPRQYLVAAANVSFAIDRKETFGLVGESGSGKSTIARMVVGLIPPSGGNVVIDGLSMTDARAERPSKNSAAVSRWCFRILTPASIRAGAYSTSSPSRSAPSASARAARRSKRASANCCVWSGLDPADGYKYPHEFSGGQRQRIAIARALASQPEFIVCDEPTSALDVSVQAQVLNLMRDLQDRLGLTYLLISHNLAVVRHMANRVGVMYLGRIVEIAPAKALFDTPRHPYTRMLLDAVPQLDPDGKRRGQVEGEIPNPIESAQRLPVPSALPACQ